MDMGHLVEEWKSMGFQIEEDVDGLKVFRDAYVTEGFFGHFYPCHWLISLVEEQGAYLKGIEPGPLVGRENFSHD